MNRLGASLVRHTGLMAATAKAELTYRFSFLTSLVWSLLSMTLVYYLWSAIAEHSTNLPMSTPALITYVCLGQAFSFGRPNQRHIFMRIRQGIRSGDVVLDLVRPADYQAMQFSTTFGSFFMDLVFVALPSFLLAVFVFGVSGPASPLAGLGFVVSLLGAYFLVSSLDFLIGILAFWTKSVWGLGYIKMAVMDVLAGGIIPLSLFPEGLRQFVMVLPFKDMAYTPLAIYTGIIAEGTMWSAILGQFAWGVALVLFTRLLWASARRRLEIQGG